MSTRASFFAAASIGLLLLAHRLDDEYEYEDEPEEDEPTDEQGSHDPSPDALRDPILTKIIKRRVLIDRPAFSVETGGRIQVQYYEADSDDPDNEDDLFLRRLRRSGDR